MKINVSTLLHESPKVRRAALAGEVVIIHTREGDLRLTADVPATPACALGSLHGSIIRSDDSIDQPTSAPDEWKPSL